MTGAYGIRVQMHLSSSLSEGVVWRGQRMQPARRTKASTDEVELGNYPGLPIHRWCTVMHL